MRGGDRGGEQPRFRRRGRSPRARGRPVVLPCVLFHDGSIPACAGETPTSYSCSVDHRVDPRVRGGDDIERWLISSVSGRSPRARGRPRARDQGRRPAGSIPACAGETLAHLVDQAGHEVDPRVRGGDGSRRFRAFFVPGRSPRARGRRDGVDDFLALLGSIPACAGETSRSGGCVEPRQVDPRVRGGDTHAQNRRGRCTGRSPRVRGRR